MAYSTCTFNPIEDEAVVAALLARANEIAAGCIELVAWPQELLPALVRHPGIQEWGVADHVERSASSSKEFSSSLEDWSDEEEEVRLRWHTTYAAAVEAGMRHAVPTMLPYYVSSSSYSQDMHGSSSLQVCATQSQPCGRSPRRRRDG